MSAEHGNQGSETNFTSVLVSIFMALLLIPQLTEKAEEVVQALVAPSAAGH